MDIYIPVLLALSPLLYTGIVAAVYVLTKPMANHLELMSGLAQAQTQSNDAMMRYLDAQHAKQKAVQTDGNVGTSDSPNDMTEEK